MLPSRFLGGQLLPLAQQIRGMSVSDSKRLKVLETEKGRLKRLLAGAFLENEATKEALRKMWPAHLHRARWCAIWSAAASE